MTDTAPTAPALAPPDPDVDTVEAMLNEWLESSLAEIGDAPADEEQVDRLIWGMRRLKERHDAIMAVARQRARVVEAWARSELEKVERDSARVEAILANWAHGERERSGRQTVKLPAGTLRLTARRQSVLIEGPSEDATVADVGALVPEAVKSTLTVQVTPLKSAGLQPGEPIEGYDAPEGYEGFTAVLPSADTDGGGGYTTIPHVVVLVPAGGREGYTFKVDAR